MNTPHTNIWCNLCQTIRPVVIVDMHADDATAVGRELFHDRV